MLGAINHPEVLGVEQQVSLKSPLPSSSPLSPLPIKMARRWGRDAGEGGGGAGAQDP